MLVAVMTYHTVKEMSLGCVNVSSEVDVIEWRLDALDVIDIELIAECIQRLPKPVILTIRTVGQGGMYCGDFNSYRSLLFQLAQLQPAYLDCEYLISNHDLTMLKKISKTTRLLRSRHYLNSIKPSCWDEELYRLKHSAVYAYKLIAQDLSTQDAIDQLSWLYRRSQDENIVSHCMMHTFSRVLASSFGSLFCYVANHGVVPGALSLEDAIQCYRIHKMNKDTQIYALLGDPVAQSIGHLFHNHHFSMNEQNAVYVKIKVEQATWQACWNQLSAWPHLKGCSITSPLKTEMTSVCQASLDESSVNTLTRLPSLAWYGQQTDGLGALLALKLTGKKKILFIGGGGANRAIALAAVQKGHEVLICQRNPESWRDWYAISGIKSVALASCADYQENYDVIVYGVLPDVEIMSEIQAWLSSWEKPATITMDLSYYLAQTAWQTWIRSLWPNIQVVDAMKMYLAQANLQQKIWYEI